MSYWRWAAVPAILLLAASIGGGWLWHRDHQTRQEIAEIETEIAAGRHALAARRLTQFLDQNPGHDQAAYLLGTCEKARGHNDQASRPGPGSLPARRFRREPSQSVWAFSLRLASSPMPKR